MPTTPDKRFTRKAVIKLLENIVGKTLGEIDSSGQFDRVIEKPKNTGIAGSVIEQSVFGYDKDNEQKCDIEIDGVPTELKTTGVRIPKKDFKIAQKKKGDDYNLLLGAKEGMTITNVTLDPTYQKDFYTSHFWEKVKNLLLVFYEYKSYAVVPASAYAVFPIVGYCFNHFTKEDQATLKSDWDIVRDFIAPFYTQYPNAEERHEAMVGFTHELRPRLLVVELVPAYKRYSNGSYGHPRYRLKKTFVDYIVRRHFSNKKKIKEDSLQKSFSSFTQLDERCREITSKYKGKTFNELKDVFHINTSVKTKSFASICIIRMFGGHGNDLRDIADFNKAGIILKTITLTPKGIQKEDMKLNRIDFKEWTDRDIDFEKSEIFEYFNEHSLLCPIFYAHDSSDRGRNTFEGFKRFAFDDEFIYGAVKQTWKKSRELIHTDTLVWEYKYDKNGHPIVNKSGSLRGAPNFPKSTDYIVFFRGDNGTSSDKHRTEFVNNIRMLPQYFWLKGSYIAERLKNLPFI